MPDLFEGTHAVHHGDAIPHMAAMPPACVDMAVFSPPFPALYSYTSSAADIGNSENLDADAKLHLSFFYRQLARVLKPGRVAIVHVMQIPRMKRLGGRGLFDYRGLNVRLAERAGLTFEYDWLVRKNPQALMHGTPVLTDAGWVAVESLSLGCRVIGSDGRATRVNAVTAHGVRPMFRVTFSDGASVDCDAEHLWSVRLNKRLSYTLTTAELLAKGLLDCGGRPRLSVPLMMPLDTPDAELPIDPYTVGVLLGDGSLTVRGSVGVCSDSRVVGNMPLPAGHVARKLPGSEVGGDTARYNVIADGKSNAVLTGLTDLGLHGVKGCGKFIPAAYLRGSIAQRRSLLAGLLDTDGTRHAKGRIKFSTISDKLAEGVTYLVRSLGGLTHKAVEVRTTYTIGGTTGPAKDLIKLTIRMPVGSPCPFRNSRHADEWVPRVKNCRRTIRSIEPVGEAECSCIAVEAEDRLFVTKDFVVTHNCQALRTKSRELQFAGLESDRSRTRGALGDYLIKFTAPGDNAVPIDSAKQVTRNEWIKWAEACWDDVIETDTLNTAVAKSESDVRHICPLQIEVIRRCVLLYSNPGEVVFSPFAGIGSEGYVALGGASPKTKLRVNDPRRFYGCELKSEYHAQCLKNLDAAVRVNRSAVSQSLFGAEVLV